MNDVHEICTSIGLNHGQFPEELLPYTFHVYAIHLFGKDCKIAIFNDDTNEIVAYTDKLNYNDDEEQIKIHLNDLLESIKKLKNKLLLDQIKTDF